jgi:hypothetical protein
MYALRRADWEKLSSIPGISHEILNLWRQRGVLRMGGGFVWRGDDFGCGS